MTDPRTLAVYAARARDYDAMPPEPEEGRLAFLAALPPGDGPILDWGCGSGHHAAAMAPNVVVEAVDASPEMVALARAKGVDARLATFDDLAPGPRYRGIWANFSLLHAAPEDIPGLIARAADALLPGGVLHLAFKRGSGSHRDTLGRRYTYLEATDLDRFTARVGLIRLSVTHGRGRGLSGEAADHIVHLSGKPDA